MLGSAVPVVPLVALYYFGFLCIRTTVHHSVFMLAPNSHHPSAPPSLIHCQALKAIAHMLLEEGVIQ